jgi:CSLREA domain-containing protein
MHVSIPQFAQTHKVTIGAFLIFFIAAAVFFLPAAAARMNQGDRSKSLRITRTQQRAASASSSFNHSLVSPASDTPASPTATFVVNDNGDAADLNIGNGSCDTNAAAGDQCTLRAAIQEANAIFGNDTITFILAPGSTITLNAALPDIFGNLTITGPGSSQLTVTRSTAGGTPEFRIFSTNNVTVGISGLTITNGKTPNGDPGATSGGSAPHGGGIWQSNGALTLTDVVITGNRSGNGGEGTGGSNSFGGWGGFGAGLYSAGTLTMTNCVVSNNTTGTGGTGGYSGGGGYGGGLQVGPGSVTLTNVIVTGNRTGDGGMGINAGLSSGNSGYGGGISSDATPLNMTNVTISNNVIGDVVRGNAGSGGGIMIFSGTATLTNSTVSGNLTGNGSGFLAQSGPGGGIANVATLTVNGSTINDNATGNSDQYSGTTGGGIYSTFKLTLVNSTISGNRTGSGSSSSGQGAGIFSAATVSMTDCTVTGNTAFSSIGSGMYGYNNNIKVRNSIIAGNIGVGDCDVAGTFQSQGHNLIGKSDGSNGFTNGSNGDQVGSTSTTPLAPLLGPLATNGGRTLTHALLDGSPALDAGDDCVTQPAHCGDSNISQLSTDQRGSGFSRIVDGPDADTTATVDIGAYERQATFPNLNDTSGNEDTTVTVAFEVLDSGSVTSVTATSSNTTLVPNDPAYINVTGSGANRTITITPVANLSGTSDITVTVNRTGSSEIKIFTLTINPVNDAPSFTKGLDQSVNENAGAQTVNNWATNISAGAADESGQTLTFQIVNNNNPGLFSVAPAISSSGTLTFTPAAGASGSAIISIALLDNGGTANGGNDTSATQTFNINVLEGGLLQFISSSYSVSEGTPSVVITVSRSFGSAGEARVDYSTTNGSAIAGTDYTATSGTLIFPEGVTSQTFSVPILDDALDETTEVIGLHLTNATGTGTIGVPADSQLLIIDDDPQPSLRIDDVAVIEGDSGTVNAVFTVTLSAVSSFNVQANYATVDGNATAGTDYQAAISQVVFNPGDLTKTISITVNGDTTPEVNEVFIVHLTGATSASIADSNGIGTILSDDAAGGTFSFNSLNNNTFESAGFATIVINRSGNTSAAATVNYVTAEGNAILAPCSTTNGFASARCDFTTAIGTLRFAAGETSRSFVVLISQDNFVEGTETLMIVLSNPTGGAVFGAPTSTITANLTIVDDATEPTTNPIDDAEVFVRQHYHDFLNREPDASGLAYWTDQIVSCGANAACVEIKRINVSAAFFLSIEFQETGYLVERLYKVSYGDALGTSTLGGSHQFPVPVIRLNEFLADSQEISLGVVVGQLGWELAVETNKQLFFDRFVQRSRFTTAFPTSMTASQFVDKLNTNAGGVLLPQERIDLINDLSTGAKTRAQVVRTITQDSDLAIAEKNRAFVLMQYFGYLRRNPNDTPDSNHTGYEFWLNKLNQFAGDFVNAEMVKAFLSSFEYRQRFAP